MNDPGIVEWLRGPAGEQWSRDRALAEEQEPFADMQVLWRATGPLSSEQDPCGSGPERRRWVTSSAARRSSYRRHRSRGVTGC